jgi:uncharacterized protein
VTSRRGGELVYPVAGLLADPPGTSRRSEIGPVDVALGPDIRLAQPVVGTLVLSRTNRGLLVRANVRASVATECSRCLRPMAVDLPIEIDEEVLPSIDPTTGAPLDTTVEPDVIRLDPHHELDLEPIIRESIELAEPIAPLHAVDCAGLCPVCGADLNESGHIEHPAEPDPRLAVLGTLRFDGEAETD